MALTRYQRRFLHHVPLTSVDQQDLYRQRHNDLEAAWSLGCIPWYGWRMPILKAISDAGTKYMDEGMPDHILDTVNEAMLDVKVDTFRLPTERDKNDLTAYLSGIVYDEDFSGITNLFETFIEGNDLRLSPIQPTNTHIGRSVDTEEMISKREKYFYFQCSVLLQVLKRLSQSLNTDKEYLRFIACYACIRIASAPLHAPSIYSDCRISIDDTNATVPLFDFWSFQYLQRNKRYLKLLSKFSEFIEDSDNWIIVPRHDFFEYFDLSPIDVAEYSSNAADAKRYNSLIQKCIETFGYKPTWPIHGYTSNQILPRMISGIFRTHERETPIRTSYCETNIFACSHDPTSCKRFKNRDDVSNSTAMNIRVCDPECLEKISRIESERLRRIVHKERPKIRCEGLRRMLGLWIWDYCQAHKGIGMSVSNAIQAVKATHFPKENPNWKPNGRNESKDGETWASYRERLLDERQLYLDYQEACRCVEAGEFLAKRTN